jgi:alpha-glucosidase (family GH31 glycosyl hydrolase)
MVLFPYIYTENHATRRTGLALLHPLYYSTGAEAIEAAYARFFCFVRRRA